MVTATELRRNLYQLLDHVLATGEPLVIKRHGQVLKIIPEQAPVKKNKLAKLKKHQGVINCNPVELIHQDWITEWSETKK